MEAELLSVNVGRPRVRQSDRGPVRTAIGKEPVAGPRWIGRLDVEGDFQADLGGHGGEQRAVLVYDVRHYAYWSERLGRDDLRAGIFGENFTVRGMPEDSVRIGDRYRIGTAEFEVTQPRVTCYRLGLQLGVRELPRLFVETGRTGFYLRVLRPGTVVGGDRVELLRPDPTGLTVVQVDRLLYGRTRPVELLRQALEIPALSPGWRASFADLLAGRAADAAGRPAPAPAWPGWRAFRVAAKEPASEVAVSLRLEPVDGGPLPAYPAGQFVSVRLMLPDGPALVRTWSLSAAADPTGWRLTVRRAGAASAYLHDRVPVGEVVELVAPRGEFTLAAAPPDAPLGFVTAGIGITPVVGMVDELLAAGPLHRDVLFLYGARSGAEHSFAGWTGSLRRADPRLTVRVLYSRPGPADRLGVEHDAVGRLDPDALAADPGPPDRHWFVCGPAELTRDILTALAAAGIPSGQLHAESFGLSARPAIPAGAATVTFARTGVTAAWQPGRAGFLLDLAEETGVPVTWSCRAGVCHLCLTGLLDGAVQAPDLPDPPPPGHVLICSSVPAGDVVLDA